MSQKVNLALVGATGAVGQAMLKVLEKRNELRHLQEIRISSEKNKYAH